jgi:hypothetical protein
MRKPEGAHTSSKAGTLGMHEPVVKGVGTKQTGSCGANPWREPSTTPRRPPGTRGRPLW